MASEDMGNCPKCRKPFVGAVEVRATEIEGIPTIVLEETPDRNWIQCDLCSAVWLSVRGAARMPEAAFATIAWNRKKAPF